MKEDRRSTEYAFARRIILAVLVILLFAFVYFIRQVFIYLTFSGLLAYLAAGPVDFVLAKLKVRRGFAVAIVLILILAIIAGVVILLIPPLSDEMTLMANNLPEALDKIEAFINDQLVRFGQGNKEAWTLRDWFAGVFQTLEADLPGIAGRVFSKGMNIISSAGALIFGLVLIPITSYYLLKDSRLFRKNLESLFNNKVRPAVSDLLDNINEALGNYIRGQILLCVIIGTLATLGLAIMGVKYPLLLGVFVGITGLIPIVGPIIGFIPAVLVALAENPWLAVWVISLLIVIRLLDDYFIAPRVMGHSMKLHPMTVIIAMLIGAHVAGVLGMLLALPVTAVLKVLLLTFLGKNGEIEKDMA